MEPYRDLILKEFKVTSFEGLIKRIVDKLKQNAILYRRKVL